MLYNPNWILYSPSCSAGLEAVPPAGQVLPGRAVISVVSRPGLFSEENLFAAEA